MTYGNYGLVVDSRFKARSFDDLIKPLAMYTQEYNALEQGINELDTKASIWENMANEQTDKNTYRIYKNYADDLRNAADQLASQGLSKMSRPALMALKSRYSKEIIPIEQAYQNRAEEIKEQRAGKAKGMVYEGDASTASLDRYLSNPSIRYGMANAQEGFQRVATAATALSKKLRDYGKGKSLDGFTRTWLQEHGYRDNEVNQAIADIEGALRGDGNVRGTNILTNILANEMQTAGVNKWNTAARMDYYNRIAPALYQAVGQTQVGTYQDQAAMMATQLAKQKELARYQKSLEKPEEPENPYYERGFSVLESTGKASKIKDLYNKLTSTKYHNGSLASRIFGKTYNNPLQIYNDYKKVYEKQQRHNLSKTSYSSEKMVSAEDAAMNFIKKKYGVTEVLTRDEAQLLRDIGFSEKSNYNDFRHNLLSKINSPDYYYGSVNLSDFSLPKEQIKQEIGARNDWDTLENTFWEMKPNGTMGKSIDKIKDLGDNWSAVDIYYGLQQPDKIVLQLNTGKRIFANPSVISSQVANIVSTANDAIKQASNLDDKDAIIKSARKQLSKLIGAGYNQVKPKTSSKEW